MITVRRAAAEDAAFIREMLLVAADWRFERPRRTVAEVMSDPMLAHYVEGWPRPGDAGVVAENADGPVGAAWWRFFPADAPGYGFVDPSIPEVSIGVRHGRRRQGSGEQMLLALVDRARAEGVDALSLSVEPDNPAVALYERLGFEVVASSGALTMVLRVPPRHALP